MDASAAHQDFGDHVMEGLAELGLKLRAELYAGETAALKVMAAYCAENRILQEANSPAARMLADILEVV